MAARVQSVQFDSPQPAAGDFNDQPRPLQRETLNLECIILGDPTP